MSPKPTKKNKEPDGIDVGLVVLHTKQDFTTRMTRVLSNSSSLCLHALIRELPANTATKAGTTPNKLKNTCKYAERWERSQQTYPGGYVYMRPDTTKLTPKFTATIQLILSTLSPHKIIQVMAEHNEFQRTGVMRVVDSKFV